MAAAMSTPATPAPQLGRERAAGRRGRHRRSRPPAGRVHAGARHRPRASGGAPAAAQPRPARGCGERPAAPRPAPAGAGSRATGTASASGAGAAATVVGAPASGVAAPDAETVGAGALMPRAAATGSRVQPHPSPACEPNTRRRIRAPGRARTLRRTPIGHRRPTRIRRARRHTPNRRRRRARLRAPFRHHRHRTGPPHPSPPANPTRPPHPCSPAAARTLRQTPIGHRRPTPDPPRPSPHARTVVAAALRRRRTALRSWPRLAGLVDDRAVLGGHRSAGDHRAHQGGVAGRRQGHGANRGVAAAAAHQPADGGVARAALQAHHGPAVQRRAGLAGTGERGVADAARQRGRGARGGRSRGFCLLFALACLGHVGANLHVHHVNR